MALLNHLSHREISKLSCNMYFARALLLVSSFAVTGLASAAVQLDDQELDQKYLKSDQGAVQVDIEQINRQTHLKQVDKILTTFISIKSPSTLTFVLDQTQPDRSPDTSIFNFANSFGEIASYQFGSEPYSYLWQGNYDQIYSLKYNYNQNFYYYTTYTGSIEGLGNVSGPIDFEVSVYSDGRRNTVFRNNYAF